MPMKLYSELLAPGAPSAEVVGSPTASAEALRGVLMAAGAELALLGRNDPDGAKISALAAQWIARLVPVWRELVSRHRQSLLQGNFAAAAPTDTEFEVG